MSTEEVSGSLTASEQAYFDSKGSTEVKDDPAPAAVEAPEPETPVIEDAETAELVDADVLDDVEAPEKPTGQSKVPLAALTKERAKAKAAETARIEAEKRAAVLEDRWNRILEQQQQVEKPAAVEIPDPLADPQGAIEWATNQIKAQQAKEAEQAQQTEADRKAQAEWTEIYTAVNQEYTAALADTPDIKSAHEALLDSQGQEFLAMGLSKEESQQEITRIEQQHIRYAKQRGIPIGNYILSLAKARGWKPGTVQQADVVDPGKEIDKLAAAVDGSTSLSQSNGAAPVAANAQSIADMSPEQFEAWLNKNGSSKFRKLAGG